MNWRVVEKPERDEVWLYTYAEIGDSRRVEFTCDGGEMVAGAPLAFNAEMQPTLRLRRSEYAALVEAIRREGPSGSVEADALADARQVRDRLLSMIEGEWQARIDTGTTGR